jgi:hypothetical protein
MLVLGRCTAPTWHASRSRWLFGALCGGKLSRSRSAAVQLLGCTSPLHAATCMRHDGVYHLAGGRCLRANTETRQS